MKEIKVKTSKGKFVVYDDANGIGKHLPYDLLTKIGYIKNLTEEQASEIVDYSILKNLYVSYSHGFSTDSYVYNTAIESLHSLLKSKGIHLFKNPYKDTLSIQSLEGSQKHRKQIEEAEEKTFYNPYIFKLND